MELFTVYIINFPIWIIHLLTQFELVKKQKKNITVLYSFPTMDHRVVKIKKNFSCLKEGGREVSKPDEVQNYDM